MTTTFTPELNKDQQNQLFMISAKFTNLLANVKAFVDFPEDQQRVLLIKAEQLANDVFCLANPAFSWALTRMP